MEPLLKHHFSAGIYAREQFLPAKHTVETHSHTYDHLSIMHGGPVVVECGTEKETYVGSACILIKAGVKHRITALGDSVWYCIHATSETDIPAIEQNITVKD
jgi:quercetin dioxygenase-like cupin family protein